MVVDNKKSPTRRDQDKLLSLFEAYRKFHFETILDEVHIEQLNYGTHFKCLWSVGVIFAAFGDVPVVEQDISPSSWKKHANWDGHAVDKGPHQGLLEDERAARCMGEFYTQTFKVKACSKCEGTETIQKMGGLICATCRVLIGMSE